jgi:hypothetical protein
MASKEEQLQARTDHPDTFIPVSDGDYIIGTFKELRVGYSDQRARGGRSGDYPLVLIDVTESNTGNKGETYWHAFSVVAENEIMRLKPVPGERVRIRYLGESKKEPAKGMNRPKLFRLEVEGRSPEQAVASAYAQLERGRPTASVLPVAETTLEQFEPTQTSFDDEIPF